MRAHRGMPWAAAAGMVLAGLVGVGLVLPARAASGRVVVAATEADIEATAEVVVVPSSIADLPGATTYPALFDNLVEKLCAAAAARRGGDGKGRPE